MSDLLDVVSTSTETGSVPTAIQKENVTPTEENEEMIVETTQAPDSIASERFTLLPTTMDDLEAAVELFNVCSMHMIGKNEATISDVRAEWLLPDLDLEKATRVAVDAMGNLVGYIEVWDIDDIPVNIWVWGRVHPDYEGLGIGTALMDWAEQRARKAIVRVPEDIRVVMRSGTFSEYGPGLDLLKDRGMKPVRHFYTMAVELEQRPPAPRWPEGIKIRPMTGMEEVRDVVWAVDDAFKDHWGYVEQPFEKELERWLHFIKNDEKFDPKLWYLAMDGDEIAGISLCSLESREDPDMGWVNTLGVRRPWRRQGLGLALLAHTFGEFYRIGKASVGLGVDASSLTGATRLYERAGMRPIRQFDTFELILRQGRDISTQQLEQ